MIPIVSLTPVLNLKNFERTYKSIILNQKKNDKWFVIIDSSSDINISDLKKNYQKQNIYIYKSIIKKGAGNTRNFGLCKIFENATIYYPFILHVIDSGDELLSNAYSIIRNIKNFKNTKIVSFSYLIINDFKNYPIVHKDTLLDYTSFLMDYSTSCLSTCVLVTSLIDKDVMSFGTRYRANDQLFFLNLVKYHKSVRLRPELIAKYNKEKNSLSSKKLFLIYYKYQALRDHGVSIIFSIIYTLIHCLKSFKKLLSFK